MATSNWRTVTLL